MFTHTTHEHARHVSPRPPGPLGRLLVGSVEQRRGERRYVELESRVVEVRAQQALGLGRAAVDETLGHLARSR
eukprot:scaffold120310_cov63-Phaeocystis_antarctica.AAC.5